MSRELFLISVLTIFNVEAQASPRAAALRDKIKKNKHFLPVFSIAAVRAYLQAKPFFLVRKEKIAASPFIVVSLYLAKIASFLLFTGMCLCRQKVSTCLWQVLPYFCCLMWIPCPRTNTPRENVETPSAFQT